MAIPNNILQQVQTYQMSGLAFLENLTCIIATANTKFKDFDKLVANLGDTVTFDLPPRFTTANTLIVTFQSAQQRVQNLVVGNAANTSFAFTDQQFIFNVRDYMDRFGYAAIKEIGAQIEVNVAQNAITNTFRYYGTGSQAINSFQQMAQAIANYKDFGAANDKIRFYLPSVDVPPIVGSGLQQFVMRRNEDIAYTWELGSFQNVDFYQSNLLPVHIAGDVAEAMTTLTLVSTNDPTGQNITQLTFSGAPASDPDAVFAGDLFQFQDGVVGQPNMRFLTFVGHAPSAQPVQFQATQNAASTAGGQVTITISPVLTLVSAQNQNQNLNNALQPGMQVIGVPSHRAGMIVGGDALYLAMPRLPEETPFPTGNQIDEDTGVSIRQYYGSLFGQNQRGMVYDCIWGSTLVPEYAMRLIFPL